ncbi:N-acetyltransferase 8 [Rhynchocyon petersi]
MAPYHIRRYLESDHPRVVEIFSEGLTNYYGTTVCHLLTLPRTHALLLGGPLALRLASGSWALALLGGLTLLAALCYLSRYPWLTYRDTCLRTDMADITKTYFEGQGTHFWVAEVDGQVVGMVGCLPVEDPALRAQRVQLFHLFVASDHRGRGIAKALVRTVLQFAHTSGFCEVVLSTTMLQRPACSLYLSLGFRKDREMYFSNVWRLMAAPGFQFLYRLPSAKEWTAP